MILGYIRVSTKEQGNGTSPEEQERMINGLAQMRGARSYDIVLFSDIGVSGSIALGDRDAGRRLLDTARSGDCVVACKLDRLFRSADDALVTAKKLKEANIDLVLIDMGVDPVTANGSAKMFFGMLAVFAEFERDRINERTEQGRQAKLARGGHVYGSATYGYRIEGKGKDSVLVPDDHEQEIIRKICATYTEKAGNIPAVVRSLREQRLRNRARGWWQYNQIQNIIKREFDGKSLSGS